MPRLFEFSHVVYSRTIKPLRDAGSKAFSEQHWSTLKATAARIEKPSLASIEQVREQIARLKKSLFHKKSDSLDVAVYPVDWQGLLQPSYRRWQIEQMKLLNDPLWWYQCFEKIEELPVLQRRAARKRLREVQKNWELQSAYAHYSTLEVIYIYQTVMPVFSAWLKGAQEELKNSKAHLTLDSRSFYENYLEWFESALEEEKILLRNSTRERLAIGLKKGYGAWDKLIESVKDELKNLAVFPPTSMLDRSLSNGHLTPEMFVAIRKIIEAEGSEEEKAKLHALAYYRPLFDNKVPFAQHEQHPLNTYAHQYRHSKDETMSVKSTVYPYLPRFLQWLFWDEEVREHFFQHPHYQFLLAQETAFLNAEVQASSTVLANLLIHPGWRQHQMCLNLLLSERERIETWLNHPLAFFFPDTVAQLEQYRKTLKQSAHHWMTKQLFLIKQSLEHKENGSLSAEEKSAIASALANIDVMQKQWLFSPEILAEIVEIKHRYHTLCNPGEGESLLPLPKSTEKQPLPLRDEFRESVKEAIKTFEVAQVFPNLQVETLKNALPMNAPIYDSVVLRTQLVDQLEKTVKLPAELKGTLETILNQPKFDEKLLNQEENAELRSCFNKNQLMLEELKQSMQVIQSPVEKPLSALDEDPWGYDQQKLEQHCQTLKDIFAKKADYPTTKENRRLCQYILRFLEKIQSLPNWEAFLLHRTQIKQLLQTVVEISVGFSSLHQALIKLATAEDTLDSNSWNSFVRTNLSVRIGTLARFVNMPAETGLTSHDAASYWSQRTLLKAPSENNTLIASSLQSAIPVPTL